MEDHLIDKMKINRIIEELSWIPYRVKNQYLCKRKKIVTIKFGGIRFPFEIIEDKDYSSLSRNLQAYRMREPRNVREFVKFVDEKDIVLDVGANIGFFTILSKNAKKIIAIEPIEKCIPVLKRNLERNDLNDVVVLNVALGNGKPLFIKEESALNLSKIVNKKGKNVRVIKSNDLKHFANKYKVNLIKIDAEGYEYEIFGKDKVPLNIDKMIMEFHIGLIGKEKSIEIIKNLYKQGFCAKKLIEDFPLRLYPFMKILWRFMTYIKKNLNEKELIEEVFKGRSVKYLYLKR